MRIAKALTLYLEQNTRAKSPSTKRHYDITLRQYQQNIGRSCRHLTNDNAARFLRWLQTQPLAPHTVNQRLDYLKAFWTWCAKRRLCREFPTIRNPTVPKDNPQAWTLEELEKLFEACRQQPGDVAGIPAGLWWYSLHLVGWKTGERIGGLLKATWANYDGQTLVIPASVRKAATKPMVYQLLPDVVESLAAIREPHRERIWPGYGGRTMGEMHPTSFYNHYRQLLRRASLPVKKGVAFHKVRRSHATHLEANGGDATRSLQHSKRSVTENSYIDLRIAKPTTQSGLLPKLGRIAIVLLILSLLVLGLSRPARDWCEGQVRPAMEDRFDVHHP